jgi:hypothetical protein
MISPPESAESPSGCHVVGYFTQKSPSGAQYRVQFAVSDAREDDVPAAPGFAAAVPVCVLCFVVPGLLVEGLAGVVVSRCFEEELPGVFEDCCAEKLSLELTASNFVPDLCSPA